MYTKFANKKLKKICECREEAVKKLGVTTATKLFQRIGEIRAVDCLATLIKLPGPRCHLLKGSRDGEYALDLDQPRRLIICPECKIKGMVNEAIEEVTIKGITNYH